MAIVREIKYFDYMENGNKLGNAGHVKVDWWDDGNGLQQAEGSLQIHVNRLPAEYMPKSLESEMDAEISLQTAVGQVLLGSMKLDKGAGSFDCSLPRLHELVGENVTYGDIWSICIPLGGDRQVFCRIHEPRMIAERESVSAEGEEEGSTVNLQEESETQQIQTEESETMQIQAKKSETQQIQAEETVLPTAQKKGKEETKEQQGLVSVPGSEDKWGHLCSIYPKITPFSDSREYLQISPNDFVLLSTKYYSLIHNSFLLHGYYQYGQLVLCRVIRRGKALYYLGTPGIYLEREKQVALMYGFQSFECDSEPATEGDFGYYMIQVEL